VERQEHGGTSHQHREERDEGERLAGLSDERVQLVQLSPKRG
jgi:hypothetical protein